MSDGGRDAGSPVDPARGQGSVADAGGVNSRGPGGALKSGPAGGLPKGSAGVEAVARALRERDYLADTSLATAVFLALRLGRPLFLEGEAGVGKTEIAKVIADWRGSELIRLQCYEGIDVSQAIYEWDYPRQLLHLRAAAAVAERGGVNGGERGGLNGGERGGLNGGVASAELEQELYSERFLLKRAVLRALEDTQGPSPVLLIDEIDRADDEFEALLLQVLADYQVTVPELGTFTARVPPVVIITSNRTRDVHDALKRRCLYHWVAHPSFEREVEIVRLRAPGVSQELAEQVATLTAALRDMHLYKAPGVAESIDWAQALEQLGAQEIDPDTLLATLGSVVKHKDDFDSVAAVGVEGLAEMAMMRHGGAR